MPFVTQVMEHWLEQEIAQSGVEQMLYILLQLII